MSVASFIPKIWNAQMLADFREAAIAANLVNRDYQGDARRGNTVTINTAAAVAIKDYKAAGRTTTADPVSATSQDLVIDQEKNFDFLVDDIDRAQAAGSMDIYTQSAGAGLAEDSDKFLLATATTGAANTLSGDGAATPAAITSGDGMFDVVRDMRKTLNKAHVPQGNRVLVLNAEAEALLLEAASKITSVDTSGSPAGLRDATIGRLLGFTIYTSENLPDVSKPTALAWYRPAMAYVSQIQESEALRATDSFSDRLRGLHVYGGKVIKSAGVVAWANV